MTFRVVTEVEKIPSNEQLEKMALVIWENGNKNWKEFTVFIYLPDMDTRLMAYAVAEFRPQGLKEFRIQEIALYGTKWESLRGKSIPTKTETQIQTETEKPTKTEKTPVTKILKAEIRFDGSQFIITNNDSFDWTDVKFKLNEGIIKAGYRLNVDRIKAGNTYTVGALQFTKPDGTRFNPFTIKPQTMFIFCDEGDWNGEWK